VVQPARHPGHAGILIAS